MHDKCAQDMFFGTLVWTLASPSICTTKSSVYCLVYSVNCFDLDKLLQLSLLLLLNLLILASVFHAA